MDGSTDQWPHAVRRADRIKYASAYGDRETDTPLHKELLAGLCPSVYCGTPTPIARLPLPKACPSEKSSPPSTPPVQRPTVCVLFLYPGTTDVGQRLLADYQSDHQAQAQAQALVPLSSSQEQA